MKEITEAKMLKCHKKTAEIPGQARNDKITRADSEQQIPQSAINAWSFRGAKTPKLFAAGE